MRTIMVVSLLAMLFLTSGCASIICGSKENVSVTSNPSDVQYRILNRNGMAIHSGVTPSTVSLKRGGGFFKKANYTVEFTRNNGEKATLPIEQNLNGLWYIGGNIIFGGLAGILVVDPLTGAMYTIEDVHIELDGVSSVDNKDVPNNNLRVLTINSIPTELRSKLIKIPA